MSEPLRLLGVPAECLPRYIGTPYSKGGLRGQRVMVYRPNIAFIRLADDSDRMIEKLKTFEHSLMVPKPVRRSVLPLTKEQRKLKQKARDRARYLKRKAEGKNP